MPIRIITTHLEFEGQVSEQRVVIEGDEPPVWGPDAALSIVGTPQPRVDGRERVSGVAEYTYDVRLPGMLIAVGLRSPHPHARVTRIDATRAEVAPGVRAVYTRFNAGDFLHPDNERPFFGEELPYAGDLVALVVAESRAQASDACALIAVDYEPLPFVIDPEAALQPDAPHVILTRENNGLSDEYPKTYERGDITRGLAEADVTVEVRFETPAALHNSLETHGATAQWDGRTLTIWTSTQDVYGSRRQVASALGLMHNQVRAIKQYMGGGFGSKFGTHSSGMLAAYAAYKLGRPVQYMLSREEENLCTGHRSPTIQTYHLGAKRDGTITAIDLHAIANVGATGGWFPPVSMVAKEMYQCPNVRTVDEGARTNLGPFAAFRAPGVVEGTAGFEVALDRLAAALNMDPLEFRRKNYAPEHQAMERPYARKLLLEAYDLAAERIGWATRDAEERRYPLGRDGHLRRGVGMASQMWGGDGGPPAQAIAKLLPDGTAVILTGTQDIGTGTRTVLAQIAAEELGLPLEHVRVELGDTEFGVFSPGSGGSMTLSSVGPAVRMAAVEARKELLEVISQLAEAPTDAIELRQGAVFSRETGKEMGTIASFLDQLDGHEITAKGMRGPNAEGMTVRTFGVQFAEVEVDVGTGEVRVLRVVACHDCGRIVNPLTFSSQIEGGIIQGLGFALMEQRIVDDRLGIPVNANLENYKVPTIRDVPEIEIIPLDRPNIHANTLGTLGAGEPPIIPTPGAIANAVAHALGRPVDALPLTPDRVLKLLNQEATV
ncbi:MAG: Periplasmic aromatic aldehyde oxidoreductase, molybdenum binding subunit YagR [Ktedonobacterales bacterium]|jgi:xanthine dehydrogenase YagR molybdenum-binding subunit|nr:MAG: Periplasmic aromatic aldehyde oxidoreductase, molybdenum binding subunit YagR [Ktedonobacterales bacterium]